MKKESQSGIAIQKVDSQEHIIVDANTKPTWWRVSLGRKITGTKRQRRYFKTYREAKDFADAALTGRSKRGTEALLVTSKEMTEAKEALDKLRPLGITLTHAIDFYLKHHRPAALNKTFAQVAAEFVKFKRSPQRKKKLARITLKSYLGYFRRFAKANGKKPLSKILAAEIEEYLGDDDEEKISNAYYNNVRRHLSMVWAYGIQKGYATINQPALTEKAPDDDLPVVILTPEQASALLEAAREHLEGRLLPYFAIALFAGLRTNELRLLNWQNIRLDSKRPIVEVSAGLAKTRRRRTVEIEDNLLAWLSLCPTRNGPVVPYPLETNLFWEDRERIREWSGLSAWPKNILRHSYGSYHLAKEHDEGHTAAQMGNSPNIIVKHYRELVAPEAADAYWLISPVANKKQRNF